MAEKDKDATKTKVETTANYEVQSRLDHDGEVYMPGDIVALTAKQAEPLRGGTIKAK